MSEDDRAAKAARAKALLKKRQQKKATDSLAASTTSAAASPGSPLRTFSPAPSEPIVEQDGRDLGDVFGHNDTSDTSWLSSLPRAATPPPPPPARDNGPPTTARRVSVTSPPAVAVSSEPPPGTAALQHKFDALAEENETLVAAARIAEAAAAQAKAALDAEKTRVETLREEFQTLKEETDTALQNERQTVSLLVAEKAHLASELQRLDGFESKVRELGDLLEAERSKSESLDAQVLRLQAQVNSGVGRAERAEAKEKELAERHKEKERELQITNASVTELRKEADESKRRLRELEEQIQGDDRVERLENSLKHTQDRADELEFQLSKLKQTHATLKGEKESLETRVSALSTADIDHQTQISALDGFLSETRAKLTVVEKEKGAAVQEVARLEQHSHSLELTVTKHQDRLGQAGAALATSARQVQTTQADLKSAIRRAEDAERMQQSLQAEGTSLMRALDEMRPKIVELTGAKLDLAEKVESLEHTVRSRDTFISQLENDLGEAREETERIEKDWKEKLAEQEKRHREIQNGTTDIQKAHAELQEELDTALASLRTLEAQRSNQHQEAARRLEEVERLTNLSQTQGEELDTLRQELEARTKARDEEQDFLERAQNEIETLQAELGAREDEIEELRDLVNTPASDAPRSLDDELLSSIRQQHAIEISAATSQVRALENTVFDKETAIHKLQKHVAGLEEQAAQLRAAAARRSPMPSRPASRALLEGDLRRASLSSPRAAPAALPRARVLLEQNMNAATLHKRQVSLSMLRARIESEAQAPSRALSPVQSDGHSHSRASSVAGHAHGHHRPQFLDEAHVFWCHACQGDLVIL
ncbi:hypothetical protein HYPSUDRAFT_197438 [Hypholoma sublateritium FD-334 SS-4]|uniref:Uncharacterized protein n=1 Tax=Hypholoma sublateritium (strain FD-334 SS-4) TaxID=945553 RepID=A0A0D2MX50_HYPSF|nr:hypothetical protein HYPSUDRAFT_197438 [Hypholoma sublateritium FD-334 SS-4]